MWHWSGTHAGFWLDVIVNYIVKIFYLLQKVNSSFFDRNKEIWLTVFSKFYDTHFKRIRLIGYIFITLLKKLISIKIISRSFYIVNNQTGEKKFVYVFLDKSAAFVKLFWIKFELCCHIEIIWYVVLIKLFFSTFKIPLNLIKSETVGYFDIIWVSGLINMDFIIGRNWYIQKMHKKTDTG